VPLAYHSSYAASKHAILGLDEAISQELRLARADRIKVVTVMPWAADTPYWQHSANYSGRTPRMILMDPPEKVVRAITYASIHPRKRISVGWKAEAAAVGDHLLPGLTEHIAGNVMQRVQIEHAPPAPATKGSLYQPVEAGSAVDGGNRARIAAENKALEGSEPR
jgi:short-subunit dehydrogenase